ncbi:MAG: methionyl-tRNA formyltransferase [Pyrinomonadaceae bacterium]
MTEQSEVKGRAVSTAPGGRGRLKILFLGNSYNRLSVECLLALLGAGHEVVVGEYNPVAKNRWRTVKDSAKSYDFLFLSCKLVELVWLKIRLRLRRRGYQFEHFYSVPAVIYAYGLDSIPCTDPNGAEFIALARGFAPDLMVVGAFSRILKAPLISVPRLGCINVHPSLLPRYRGPDPHYWVLANGERTTGVTVHHIDEGIDSGKIIAQRELAVRPGDTEMTLQARANVAAAQLLGEAVSLVAAGKAPAVEQNEAEASYYSFPPRKKGRKSGLVSSLIRDLVHPLL